MSMFLMIRWFFKSGLLNLLYQLGHVDLEKAHSLAGSNSAGEV